MVNGPGSFMDMVGSVKEQAQTARAFVPPRFGLNKSRGATSTARPVGVMEQKLYDELDRIALQLDSSQRRRDGRRGQPSTSLKAILKVVDNATKSALDAAFMGAQAIAKLEGHTFFWTAYIDVEDDPGKTNAVKQFVTSAVVQNGWTASPDYLLWCLTSWGQRHKKAEYVTRLRKLLSREAELAWQERHLKGELFREAAERLRSLSLSARDQAEMYVDEVAVTLEIEAGVNSANLKGKRHELDEDVRWLALEADRLSRAANLSQRHVKAAFKDRPDPSAPWPWRDLDPLAGYRPEKQLQPGWPFASPIRGEDIDDAKASQRLWTEGHARSQLGTTLHNTSIYEPIDSNYLQSTMALLADAAWTLRVSGWLLQESAGDESRNCKVCGRHLNSTDKVYCRQHNQSKSTTNTTPERTHAYRLARWGQARSDKYHALVAQLMGNNAHEFAKKTLSEWWESSIPTSHAESIDYLDLLRYWTGDDIYHRLRTLIPIASRIARENPAGRTHIPHPAFLFALHFKGTAGMIQANSCDSLPGPNIREISELAGNLADLQEGSDPWAPLALIIFRTEQKSENWDVISACLDFRPQPILAQLLMQRAWIEVGGARLDKLLAKNRTTPHPTPAPYKKKNIDKGRLLHLQQSGWKNADIARELGVSRSAVTQMTAKLTGQREPNRSP